MLSSYRRIVSGVLINVDISSTVIFEAIFVILFDEAVIHFLDIYSLFISEATPSKSSFQTIFIENVLVHDAVIALIVLIPLVHFLVIDTTNLLSTEVHESIRIEVSFVVQDVTPGHLIGNSKVSVIRSE